MIYKYKNEEISPKNVRNPIELFKDLREVTINPNEVLKDQINFKSNLGEMKKGNKKLKSKDQISVIQNVQIFFDLREKIIDFLGIIIFCYLRLNTKQNMQVVSKY